MIDKQEKITDRKDAIKIPERNQITLEEIKTRASNLFLLIKNIEKEKKDLIHKIEGQMSCNQRLRNVIDLLENDKL